MSFIWHLFNHNIKNLPGMWVRYFTFFCICFLSRLSPARSIEIVRSSGQGLSHTCLQCLTQWDPISAGASRHNIKNNVNPVLPTPCVNEMGALLTGLRWGMSNFTSAISLLSIPIQPDHSGLMLAEWIPLKTLI